MHDRSDIGIGMHIYRRSTDENIAALAELRGMGRRHTHALGSEPSLAAGVLCNQIRRRLSEVIVWHNTVGRDVRAIECGSGGLDRCSVLGRHARMSTGIVGKIVGHRKNRRGVGT